MRQNRKPSLLQVRRERRGQRARERESEVGTQFQNRVACLRTIINLEFNKARESRQLTSIIVD